MATGRMKKHRYSSEFIVTFHEGFKADGQQEGAGDALQRACPSVFASYEIKEFIMMKNALLISVLTISFLFPTTLFCKDTLHKAAYNGDAESVRKILKSNVNPDERDSFGGTALHATMFQKNTEIITLLINYGFNVNAQGLSNGYTPFHDAVWANNLDAVKILLKHGAGTNIRGKDGLTPYEKALKEDRKGIVEYFRSVAPPSKN